MRILTAASLLLALSAVPALAQTTAQKRAAIQKACDSGVLTPEECQAKLAAVGGPAKPAAAPAAGGPTTLWHEPRGRFTIAVPAGWQVDESGGNLKITNGGNWAIFETTSQPGGPMAVAQRNADQMKSMVSNWRVDGQGAFTAGGHPAGGVTAICSVPTRTGSSERVMMFAAQGAGNNNYVTMTSSTDAAGGADAKMVVARAFDSVRFGSE